MPCWLLVPPRSPGANCLGFPLHGRDLVKARNCARARTDLHSPTDLPAGRGRHHCRPKPVAPRTHRMRTERAKVSTTAQHKCELSLPERAPLLTLTGKSTKGFSSEYWDKPGEANLRCRAHDTTGIRMTWSWFIDLDNGEVRYDTEPHSTHADFHLGGNEGEVYAMQQGEAMHEAEPHDSNGAERACDARPTPQAHASRACYGEHHPTAWRGVCPFCTHRDRPHCTRYL